jgi:hypothetical protein
MKKNAVILSIFIFFSACSSAADEPVNNNAGSSASANQTAANSNVVVVSNANSQVVPLEGVDPNAFNGNSSNLRTVERDTSNMKPTLGTRRAPDESVFEAKGRPDGSFVETRTFKNHPQLSKIEKITNGKNVSMKVYLKNGKSYPFTEEQIPNYRAAAPQNILLAVGVQPVYPDQPKSDTKGDKEEGGKQ